MTFSREPNETLSPGQVNPYNALPDDELIDRAWNADGAATCHCCGNQEYEVMVVRPAHRGYYVVCEARLDVDGLCGTTICGVPCGCVECRE